MEDNKTIEHADPNAPWTKALTSPFPLVGQLSSSDLSAAGHTLEQTIGLAINQPVAGKIWNDNTKQFLTTPDDVRKALELIVANPTIPKSSSRDDRMACMAQLLLRK